MPDFKPQFEASAHEFEPPHHFENQKSVRASRSIDSVRLGLTVITLLCAVTILGTAGDALSVYNTTHLAPNFFLPLWPSNFDIRPTVALVVCSSIILVSSILSLIVNKVPAIRKITLLHSIISVLGPLLSLVAAIVGMSFFYGVNASTTQHSLQSWTCQWSSIAMDVKPHWGTLCRESKVAVDLMTALVPVQMIVLGTAAWGAFIQGKQARLARGVERKGSPALS